MILSAKAGAIWASHDFMPIHHDREFAQEKGIKIDANLIHETISKEVGQVNAKLTPYKRIVRFYIRENEFEKTTTQKIKRYLVK